MRKYMLWKRIRVVLITPVQKTSSGESVKRIGYGKVSARNEVINRLEIFLLIGSFMSFLLDYFHFKGVKG